MCNSNFSYGCNPCNAPAYERIVVSDCGCSDSVIDPDFSQGCGCSGSTIDPGFNQGCGCGSCGGCPWNTNCGCWNGCSRSRGRGC